MGTKSIQESFWLSGYRLIITSLIYKLRLIYDYRHDNVLLGQAPSPAEVGFGQVCECEIGANQNCAF